MENGKFKVMLPFTVGGITVMGNVLWGRWMIAVRAPVRICLKAAVAYLSLRGYWVSAFPEGDGLSFDPPSGMAPEAVREEVEKVFAACFSASRLAKKLSMALGRFAPAFLSPWRGYSF